jgi:hypothetical protein
MALAVAPMRLRTSRQWKHQQHYGKHWKSTEKAAEEDELGPSGVCSSQDHGLKNEDAMMEGWSSCAPSA